MSGAAPQMHILPQPDRVRGKRPRSVRSAVQGALHPSECADGPCGGDCGAEPRAEDCGGETPAVGLCMGRDEPPDAGQEVCRCQQVDMPVGGSTVYFKTPGLRFPLTAQRVLRVRVYRRRDRRLAGRARRTLRAYPRRLANSRRIWLRTADQRRRLCRTGRCAAPRHPRAFVRRGDGSPAVEVAGIR